MIPECFCRTDISAFLAVAAEESWIAEQWELEFLLEVFPAGCLVMRNDGGKAVAFVTSMCHHRSGWIGNLIVSKEFRGRGLGERLFQASLNALHRAGMETVWLTASKMGMRMYEKSGFERVDTIQRWVGKGGCAFQTSPEFPVLPSSAVVALDALPWGDCREQLLTAVMGRGESLVKKEGFITLQPCGTDCFQFGPFVALDPDAAKDLLRTAIKRIMPGNRIYVDTPASNSAACLMLKNNSFRIAGSNELMYRGKTPDYRSQLLFGLATMGSCG